MASQQNAFDRECLEALVSIAKTLGQMSLYKIGHPAVAGTLALAEQRLTEALAQTDGELVFSIDQDKWIANGRIIGTTGQTPTAIINLFNRFKLGSLSFLSGLTNAELAALCELAAMRTDAPQAQDPKGYLAGRDVTRILFNEAVYAKMDEAPPPPVAAAEGDGGAPAEELIQAMEGKTVEDALQTLVNKAVPDVAERSKVYERVARLLREDIQKRVDEVTKALNREKNILQNEQARTGAVLQNMAEGVVVVDENGKILMMNPAAEHIYGTTLAQAAGTHIAEKTGEEHLVTLAVDLQDPTGDADISKEVTTKAVPDTGRTLKASGAVVQNQAGKVVGMVTSLPDVAKHKELQRMQRDFVAHVTHELRAPLSSIRAAIEILQGTFEGKLKDDEERLLASALKNSDRLADLINSILDFSKIESGQMTVFPKRADPEKIAREAVDSLTPWCQKKKVALSLKAPPGLPVVSADSGRTVQVLVNLLSNAIKFTPAGGSIDVRLDLAQAGQERFIQFAVKDTGAGIPKSEQKRIFEKFVQIAAGEMHVGGTGLGLAIAKALVHLQGGKMWVESEEGKGSTFLFTLPVHVAPRDGTVAQEQPVVSLPWWKKLLGLKK